MEKLLKKLKTDKYPWFGTKLSSKEVAILIDVLEKQKPMKVTSPRGTYPNEYGVTMYEYDCPNCGVTIEFESLGCYEPEYCDECGQKLDWEE